MPTSRPYRSIGSEPPNLNGRRWLNSQRASFCLGYAMPGGQRHTRHLRDILEAIDLIQLFLRDMSLSLIRPI
jgi:hypothetical protein